MSSTSERRMEGRKEGRKEKREGGRKDSKVDIRSCRQSSVLFPTPC